MRRPLLAIALIAASALPAARSQGLPTGCTSEQVRALDNHHTAAPICDYLFPETTVARTKHIQQLAARYPACHTYVSQTWSQDGEQMKSLRAMVPKKAEKLDQATRQWYRDLCSDPTALDTLGAKALPQ